MLVKHGLVTIGLAAMLSQQAFAPYFAINNIKPYDRYFWTGPQDAGTLQINAYAAKTFHEKGAQWDNCKEYDIVQMYEKSQNSLAMIKGFDPASTIGRFAASFNGIPDDCKRGYMTPSGFLHAHEYAISMRYWFEHHFCLGLYLPIMHMKLCNLSWTDQTADITANDIFVKKELTNCLGQRTMQLGNLNINRPWSHTGFGDLSVIAMFERYFPQNKPILTNVLLSAYLGLSLPTGKLKNEDEFFSMPFGYDGATGLLFGATLGLYWKEHFTGGIDSNFIQLMGNSRCRRIKTDLTQTELLLLAKTPAHIDWGFIQRYRIYAGVVDLFKGLSAEVVYQFLKQGNSFVSLNSNDYITSIANTAFALKEWTLHQIQVDAHYDFGFNKDYDTRVKPSIGLFYQHDFKGHRAIRADRIGLFATLSF